LGWNEREIGEFNGHSIGYGLDFLLLLSSLLPLLTLGLQLHRFASCSAPVRQLHQPMSASTITRSAIIRNTGNAVKSDEVRPPRPTFTWLAQRTPDQVKSPLFKRLANTVSLFANGGFSAWTSSSSSHLVGLGRGL
jgi:hypothetical protein